jgi:hypothetical protein
MKYLFLLLPFLGYSQDSLKIYEVIWYQETMVELACPDGKPNCLVYHGRLEVEQKSKKFANYQDANDCYKYHSQVNRRNFFMGTSKHEVELRIYKMSLQDILDAKK